MRTFMIVGSPCYGATGGGHGIEYRLYESNQRYNLIENLYYIFSDRVIEPKQNCGELATRTAVKKKNKVYSLLRKFKPDFLRIKRLKDEYQCLDVYFKKLNEKYAFSNDDIYIFQDVKTAYVFTEIFNVSKCAVVFHMQGSMYNEWKVSLGIESGAVHEYFNNVFIRTMEKIRYLCFPSNGTKESLIETEPLLENLVEKKDVRILYNGIECPNIHEISPWITDIKQKTKVVFSTVAVFNSAKAVERIPHFLGLLKQHGIDFMWILIGNGVNFPIVDAEIKKAKIEDNVIWKKDYVKHQEILELMTITDFYILFHRQSIFDLSTLEAMHYGAIPLLTPVGGNKEVILNGNGLFIDDFDNVDGVADIITNNKISLLKDKNRLLQKEKFNDKAMLIRYKNLVKEIETCVPI